jgi:hypothetical protein
MSEKKTNGITIIGKQPIKEAMEENLHLFKPHSVVQIENSLGEIGKFGIYDDNEKPIT